jgi:hypothetical protein
VQRKDRRNSSILGLSVQNPVVRQPRSPGICCRDLLPTRRPVPPPRRSSLGEQVIEVVPSSVVVDLVDTEVLLNNEATNTNGAIKPRHSQARSPRPRRVRLPSLCIRSGGASARMFSNSRISRSKVKRRFHRKLLHIRLRSMGLKSLRMNARWHHL